MESEIRLFGLKTKTAFYFLSQKLKSNYTHTRVCTHAHAHSRIILQNKVCKSLTLSKQCPVPRGFCLFHALLHTFLVISTG